ncbi:FtsB family cell division protein [Floccifex sp.]|uniref:FtsB family cell division protein n=1 Tax=Floccifex sp. TaxID=2815810 RepID=UPI002A74E1CF|nr:septum formation initiator family protein [Floccifex sp.]MDD7281832.1 septum formation initiator family protein [Erysipelotrichaceae bacterium]MDY2958517.1 septum formation initiator family protein [Floccifex sp.]
MKTKKKKKLTLKMLLVYTILLSGAGYMLYSSFKELETTAEIRLSMEENEKESQALDARKAELEQTKENLENPDYIEYLARGKYLVTKDGEQVFKFSD